MARSSFYYHDRGSHAVFTCFRGPCTAHEVHVFREFYVQSEEQHGLRLQRVGSHNAMASMGLCTLRNETEYLKSI